MAIDIFARKASRRLREDDRRQMLSWKRTWERAEVKRLTAKLAGETDPLKQAMLTNSLREEKKHLAQAEYALSLSNKPRHQHCMR